MKSLNLAALPDEVLALVLQHCTPAAVVALERTARRFADVANEPLLWKHYCIAHFRYWSAEHDFDARLCDSAFLDWKPVYRRKRTAYNATLSNIKSLSAGQPALRLGTVEEIVRSWGYDAKDALLSLMNDVEETPDHLARRYWTYVAWGLLHRSAAIEEWTSLKADGPKDDSFVRAIGAFDLFIISGERSGDLDEISSTIADHANNLRLHNPGVDSLTPRRKAILVAEYVREKELVGIRPGRNYYNLENMFLGIALHSQHHNSVPLISAVIYCTILRHFNLSASPISFPMHVYAIVRPPPGLDLDGRELYTSHSTGTPVAEPLYMDPFNTAEPVPSVTLMTQINFLAPRLSPAYHASFLSEATPQELTFRNARNIIQSPNETSQAPLGPPIPSAAAAYAGHWASAILPRGMQRMRDALHNLMHAFLSSFPSDVGLVERHIVPLLADMPHYHEYRAILGKLRLADLMAAAPTRRHEPADHTRVRFKVGDVFRHRRYGYQAVVVGWDGRCNMGEQWIVSNRVDALEGGRVQPFYHVLCQDGSSRYVAEENIEVDVTITAVEAVSLFPIEVGRSFKRFEAGVFVSNLRNEYPDDAALQDEYLARHRSSCAREEKAVERPDAKPEGGEPMETGGLEKDAFPA